MHANYTKRVSALDSRPIGEKGPGMERVKLDVIVFVLHGRGSGALMPLNVRFDFPSIAKQSLPVVYPRTVRVL